MMVRLLVIAAVLVIGLGERTPVWAQPSLEEEEEIGWSDTAEFTLVFTGGNAEASTIGITNTLVRRWADARLSAEIGALRAESTTFRREAIGSPTNFDVQKNALTMLIAESYYLRGRYDREISSRTFWYAGTGWDRDTFAGIESRYSVGGGVGNTWVDGDLTAFSTAYGLTYTFQNDVTSNAASDDNFSGLRLSYDFRQRLTETTQVTSVLVIDENLKETADFRSDLTNAVTVSMTSQLALKISWQALYDRQPALVSVVLVSPGGTPTGERVLAELDRVDNRLRFALVASF